MKTLIKTSDPETEPFARRKNQVIRNVHAMLAVHSQLRAFVEAIQVTIEHRAVVLRGRLPSKQLKDQLIPAVRQSGVLWKVNNQVDVA